MLFTLPECPKKWLLSSPVAAFQSLAVLSHEPVNTCLPFGEKATPDTPLACPESDGVVSHRLNGTSSRALPNQAPR